MSTYIKSSNGNAKIKLRDFRRLKQTPNNHHFNSKTKPNPANA
jgi:hypothetical protein